MVILGSLCMATLCCLLLLHEEENNTFRGGVQQYYIIRKLTIILRLCQRPAVWCSNRELIGLWDEMRCSLRSFISSQYAWAIIQHHRSIDFLCNWIISCCHFTKFWWAKEVMASPTSLGLFVCQQEPAAMLWRGCSRGRTLQKAAFYYICIVLFEWPLPLINCIRFKDLSRPSAPDTDLQASVWDAAGCSLTPV